VNIHMRLATTALLIFLTAGPAYPQNRDILQLQKDMIEVQTRMRQLQTTVDQDNAFMKTLTEKIADQVSTLAAGMQKMSQTVDGIKTQNDTAARELKTVLTTLNSTVRQMEQELKTAQGQIGSVSREITSLKTTSEPIQSADELWRLAYADYSAGNLDLAIEGYQEFISKHPNDPRNVSAHVRLGDVLRAQKKYDAAVAEYDFVLQKFPESDTSRDALLKKGLAQADANQPQAIQTLSEVVKKFPNTIESNTAAQKLKEIQAAQRKPPAR
jgi:TolA-binding protein